MSSSASSTRAPTAPSPPVAVDASEPSSDRVPTNSRTKSSSTRIASQSSKTDLSGASGGSAIRLTPTGARAPKALPGTEQRRGFTLINSLNVSMAAKGKGKGHSNALLFEADDERQRSFLKRQKQKSFKKIRRRSRVAGGRNARSSPSVAPESGRSRSFKQRLTINTSSRAPSINSSSTRGARRAAAPALLGEGMMKTRYPMLVMNMATLMGLEKLLPHQEMLRGEMLIPYNRQTMVGRIIFVSHQCTDILRTDCAVVMRPRAQSQPKNPTITRATAHNPHPPLPVRADAFFVLVPATPRLWKARSPWTNCAYTLYPLRSSRFSRFAVVFTLDPPPPPNLRDASATASSTTRRVTHQSRFLTHSALRLHPPHPLHPTHPGTSYANADHTGIQLKTLKDSLQNLMDGKVSQVEMSWAQQLAVKQNTKITAAQWKASLPRMYIWIDYSCIPQPSAGPLSHTIIPSEVSRRGTFFTNFAGSSRDLLKSMGVAPKPGQGQNEELGTTAAAAGTQAAGMAAEEGEVQPVSYNKLSRYNGMPGAGHNSSWREEPKEGKVAAGGGGAAGGRSGSGGAGGAFVDPPGVVPVACDPPRSATKRASNPQENSQDVSPRSAAGSPTEATEAAPVISASVMRSRMHGQKASLRRVGVSERAIGGAVLKKAVKKTVKRAAGVSRARAMFKALLATSDHRHHRKSAAPRWQQHVTFWLNKAVQSSKIGDVHARTRHNTTQYCPHVRITPHSGGAH